MVRERFEEALQKLERVVAKLEEGNIPLEESLRLFEEGIRLSRFCNQKLEEAEKKVEILMEDRDGALRARPFDPFRPAADATEVSEKDKPGDDEAAEEET